MITGRPTVYSPEVVEEICNRIAEGESLRKICESDHLPTRETVRLWLADETKSDFLGRYARAREEQADYYADEIIQIADEATDHNKARLQIDSRKWVASKLKTKAYGDKVDHTSGGEKLPTPILGGQPKE